MGEIYGLVSEEISIFPPLFVRIDGHALIVKRYDYLATYISILATVNGLWDLHLSTFYRYSR